MRALVVALVLLGAGIAALIAWSERTGGTGEFEFGHPTLHQGILHDGPAPTLAEGSQTYLLAGEGKHGVAEVVQGLDGKRTQLRGSLIRRDGVAMLELPAGSLRTEGTGRQEAEVALGQVEIRGEIVDSKCYLGAMNPGEGKVHRSCAARCISGGVPPALLARDANGKRNIIVLLGSDGRAVNRQVLAYVAEPVRLSGALFRRGNLLILRIDPAHIVRE